MDDAVAHDDAEAEWTPVVLRQRIDNAVTDVIVVGGRIEDFSGNSRDRLQQVGALHYPDDLVSACHRQPFDVVFFHQLDDFFERRILTDSDRLRCHDLGYLAPVLANEIDRLLTRAKNEFQKSAALALGADFTATNEIALGDDADELAGGVDHRQPAYMLLKHG